MTLRRTGPHTKYHLTRNVKSYKILCHLKRKTTDNIISRLALSFTEYNVVQRSTISLKTKVTLLRWSHFRPYAQRERETFSMGVVPPCSKHAISGNARLNYYLTQKVKPL